jgi:hypothetical protein
VAAGTACHSFPVLMLELRGPCISQGIKSGGELWAQPGAFSLLLEAQPTANRGHHKVEPWGQSLHCRRLAMALSPIGLMHSAAA